MVTLKENKEFHQFDDFYAFYLLEHSKPITKIFHCIGTSLGLICLVLAVIKLTVGYFFLGLFLGYLFPWISHFFLEKNLPATFKYPAWSFQSDFKMYFEIMTFRRKLTNNLVL
jgi:hypothetical protein